MNDPCRLELRGLSGSEPCGACNHPAREHRGHREYVEPEYWTVEYMIGNSDWISHGLGVYTTRAGAEEALASCSISDDRIRLARCDASSRIIGAVVETFPPAVEVPPAWVATAPDRTMVTMSQEAYDAAISVAKQEGWSRAVLKLRDGHRFVQASDCLAMAAPSSWPTPPNPLTKIAAALGCDEDEAACLDAIDSLRRELECAEDASSMERQRRKYAESARDDRPAITRKQARAWLDLAIEHGFNTIPTNGSVEYVAALALAKFADGQGPLRTHDAETEALRARVRELESDVEARTRATNRSLDRYREESDALRAVDSRTRAKIEESGYQRGVEEAATAALTTARHCQISSFVDGRTYELLDRDEVVRAIRALADRGAK